MRRMSDTFQDLVTDVREVVQKGVNVSSGPPVSIIIREKDPRRSYAAYSTLKRIWCRP